MKNKKQKFRASFSILNCYASGDWINACRMYFKLPTYTNEAMERGKDFHQLWETEIKTSGRMPSIFGGQKLIDPRCELKLEASLNNWLDLVGVVDLYSDREIHEFKTGIMGATHYLNSFQLGLYGILLELSGFSTVKANIHAYNPTNRTVEFAEIWVTEKLIKKAGEWLTTHASDMYQYILDNRLFELSREELDNRLRKVPYN